jgi:hypothetical protein
MNRPQLNILVVLIWISVSIWMTSVFFAKMSDKGTGSYGNQRRSNSTPTRTGRMGFLWTDHGSLKKSKRKFPSKRKAATFS